MKSILKIVVVIITLSFLIGCNSNSIDVQPTINNDVPTLSETYVPTPIPTEITQDNTNDNDLLSPTPIESNDTNLNDNDDTTPILTPTPIEQSQANQQEEDDFTPTPNEPDDNEISVPSPTPTDPPPTPTDPPQTQDPDVSNDNDAIDPSFKAAMDSYEAFFDEYILFMIKYQESDDVLSLLTDYMSYMEQFADTMTKLNAVSGTELTTAELIYYTEVNARIMQKLLAIQ